MEKAKSFFSSRLLSLKISCFKTLVSKCFIIGKIIHLVKLHRRLYCREVVFSLGQSTYFSFKLIHPVKQNVRDSLILIPFLKNKLEIQILQILHWRITE